MEIILIHWSDPLSNAGQINIEDRHTEMALTCT